MKFLKEMFGHYLKSNTFEKGAALSYYVAFSFLPMIVIVISVLGLIFREFNHGAVITSTDRTC